MSETFEKRNTQKHSFSFIFPGGSGSDFDGAECRCSNRRTTINWTRIRTDFSSSLNHISRYELMKRALSIILQLLYIERTIHASRKYTSVHGI